MSLNRIYLIPVIALLLIIKSEPAGQAVPFVFQRFVDPLPIPAKIQAHGPSDEIAVTLNQFKAKIHRDLPETTLWGYNGGFPGPTIEVEKGQNLKVHWKNELPTTHFLPLPKDMKNMDMGPDVRTVTHLHGAVVSESNPLDRHQNNDGWPDAWMVPGQEQVAEYPNTQEARTLWYHDHAIGTTGRNVAAGLVGMYIIHDEYERSLGLPSGEFEIPLMIRAEGLNADGSRYYTEAIANEFYGNSITVNGKLWPYLDVQPRKYRFRIVNASNARSYGLKLLDTADQSAGPAFVQIGSDGGFLENAAVLNDPKDANAPRLVLAPAERADVIIDFSLYAGKTLLLHNNSIDPGDSELALPQVMQLRVARTVSQPDMSALPMRMKPIRRMQPVEAVASRRIVFDQMTMPDGSAMLLLNGKHWGDAVTEKPVLGTTEIWELVNTLPDIHPFHIHLVQFQVLDRRPFDVDAFEKTGAINYTGPVSSPDANEMGWKDTVRISPRAVTRIIMNFAPYAGHYVYHCHILEHEDMDMMRPFEIITQ